MSKLLTYRPSVAALIFDAQARFLLVQLNGARDGEFDFVKGGVKENEEKETALNRELKEELGPEFTYKIIEQSYWYLVYDWSKELQNKKGFLGQARTSFWVKYKGGEIKLNPKELRSSRWFSEIELGSVLLDSGFPKILVENLLNEWKQKRGELLQS